MRRAIGLITAVVIALAPAGASASAPPTGVHVDPGSPAGKEYQLPVGSARGETSGSSSNSANPPLFGTGITPPGAGGTTASTGRSGTPATSTGGATGTRGGPTAHAAGARHSAPRPAPAPRQASSPQPPAGRVASFPEGAAGGNGWIPLVGGGLVVLAVGGGLGLLVRRRIVSA